MKHMALIRPTLIDSSTKPQGSVRPPRPAAAGSRREPN
jgi:hypothetical protein